MSENENDATVYEISPQEAAQLQGVAGGVFGVEEAAQTATENIKEGLRESKAEFWFGFMAGTVFILGARYLLEGRL